jgi:hypothetical protein
MRSIPLTHAIFRSPQPEDLELPYRRAELAALRAALSGRELELAHLRVQLHSFEGRYIRQVGVLYVQLDEWEDHLAELLASRNPAKPEAAEPTEGYWTADRLAEQAIPEPEPVLNLRALFREVAKRIHPDLATSAQDERRRTQLMAQANDALRRQDADLLHRMLHGHDLVLHRETPAVELARILQLIAQTEADLAGLDAVFTALATSEMAQLRETTVRAALLGRDHLAEMAARVKGTIGVVMGRYERESSPNRRPAAIDPVSLLSADALP